MVTVAHDVLTGIEERITGKRYCTSCQWTKPLEGGKKRGSRWVCATCIENRRTKAPSELYGRKK